MSEITIKILAIYYPDSMNACNKLCSYTYLKISLDTNNIIGQRSGMEGTLPKA
jgi:hypothetical protein